MTELPQLSPPATAGLSSLRRHFSRARGVWALGELALGLFFLAVAQVCSSSFLTIWGKQIAEQLPAVLRFEVARPFAFRVGSPWVINRAMELVGRDRLASYLNKPIGEQNPGELVGDYALTRYGFPAELGPEMLLIEVFFVVVLLATTYTWRGMLSDFALPPQVCMLAPGLFLLAIPAHFAGGGYLYDFPEILLASVATWAFIQRRFWVFYPTLTLAALNKESALLLCAFCLVFVLKRNWRAVLVHGGLCAIFSLLPVIATRIAFAETEGAGAVNYLTSNVPYLLSKAPLLGRAKIYSPLLPYPVALNLLLLIVVAFFVGYRFRRRAWELRTMFLALFGCLAPLYLVFGWENEVRVFGPCFPLAFVFAAHTLSDLLQLRASSNAEASDPT